MSSNKGRNYEFILFLKLSNFFKSMLKKIASVIPKSARFHDRPDLQRQRRNRLTRATGEGSRGEHRKNVEKRLHIITHL
ncbi:MAG: hypothetical protein CL912_27405 [Deltaproteobacteria bacterium]|nr:hypothetical protein [Deltaproteobacteria bacterium]